MGRRCQSDKRLAVYLQILFSIKNLIALNSKDLLLHRFDFLKYPWQVTLQERSKESKGERAQLENANLTQILMPINTP